MWAMPDWWVVVGFVVQFVGNVFGFGWLASSVRGQYAEIGRQSARALELAQRALDGQSDLETALGMRGVQLDELSRDHADLEQRFRGSLVDLPAIMDRAVDRALTRLRQA